MKFSVVLRLGLTVSELVVAYSKYADNLSPCQSAPNAMISLSVTRAPVSLEKTFD